MSGPDQHQDPLHELFPGLWGGLWLVVAALCVEALVDAVVLSALPGLAEMEQVALGRLLANAVLFSALMSFKRLGYRSLFHSRSGSVVATLALTVPPVLALVPALLIAEGWVQSLLVWLVPMSTWEQRAFEQMASLTPGTIVLVCVLAPVLEEMLFRGIILRSFLKRYPRGVAIAHSAGLFGLAHWNLYQFVGAMGLGLLAGWLYERTRSLWPCIALHAGYNTACVLLAQGADPNADFSAAAVAAALASGVLAAWWLRRCLRPQAG
jgi:membrane protease YdiL (CAAX protease family)